ncbi:TIR domain-containing protein [Nocardiopsis sp. NPDC055551]
MGKGAPERPGTFFTSYGGRKADRAEVLRFHADLERAVRLHTDDHATGLSGPSLEQGGRWREELLKHCATAATMVVLLSETQLDSEWCAREWGVFEERLRRFRSNGSVNGEAAQPLLPLVWTPLIGPLPIAVRGRQRLDWVEPVGHADRGVLDLMYTSPDDYRALCFRVGGLVARAAATPLPPLPLDEAASVRPAWDARARAKKGGDPGLRTKECVLEEIEPGDPLRRRVAHVLSHVPGLDEEHLWRAFLSRLGELRGGRAQNPLHWPVTEPRFDRVSRLVEHLSHQHRSEDTIAWLSQAVRETTGIDHAADALASLDPDPVPGPDPEAERSLEP